VDGHARPRRVSRRRRSRSRCWHPHGTLGHAVDERTGIRFVLEADDPARIRFARSAAYEAALSLRVLADPKRHAVQHGWVRHARRLPAGLRREVEAFRFAWLFGPPDFMLPTGVVDDFDEELERFRALPAELVAFEFLRPFWDHSGDRDPALLERKDVREHVARRVAVYGGEREHALLLFDHPEELRERFLAGLEGYWTNAFADEWARLAPALDEARREGEEQIALEGIWPLLASLRPRLVSDPAVSEFGIDIPHHHRVEVTAERPLTLVPSAFVWPGVQVNCDEPFPLTLVYPAPSLARTARPKAPGPELLRGLRALGDDTRLRALRLIAQAPRSTQELSSLIVISEAGLSKHLRILSDAGFVQTRREGYYVLYGLADGALEALPADVRAYLTS
jgi:DNA-binding transcriptional ArsR family regulator